MMRRVIYLLPLFLLVVPTRVYASSCPVNDPCDSSRSPSEKVSCYTNVVNICANERQSMTSQVIYLTTKIQLANAKISSSKQKIIDLEEEINQIGEKIGKLETSLTAITKMFLTRIVATYKYGDVSYLMLMLNTREVSDFVMKYKYVQSVQAHDRRLLFQLQNSKENFEDQKKLREDKKIQLDSVKKELEKEEVMLASQKKEKELFLETTRNSESKYAQELASAKREAEGIQQAASLLSQAGVAKHVNRGEVIGIMGNTGFSTGSHLHLSVYNLKESDLGKFDFNSGYDNPLSMLSARSLPFDATSCDDVSTTVTTTKSAGAGSWAWPMDNPVISQCFGHTPWSWRYQSGIHNGLDMYDDKNTLIHAIESGNAYVYRGGQAKGNGVFIFHNNGKMSLYWHLQ